MRNVDTTIAMISRSLVELCVSTCVDLCVGTCVEICV